jgi:hypothetical protein
VETPFQNLTEAIKAGYIHKTQYELKTSNPKELKHPKNQWYAEFGSDVDPTEPETYIDNVNNVLFPDKKKYIYTSKTVHQSDPIVTLVNEIKHLHTLCYTRVV